MGTNVGISVQVVTTGNTDAWLRETELNAKSAIRAMANAALQRAQMLAPMSNIEGHAGTLRATGIVFSEDDGFVAIVEFGNGIPYARYQEFGSEDWHFTTPGTGPHYLKTAGDSVAKEGIKSYL